MSVLKVGAIQPNSGTKVNITGSTLLVTTASGHFSGSYEGDGSRLSGVAGFPFTGSGTVSGSLIVTGSSTLALRVSGSTALTGSLLQSGSTRITGSVDLSGSLNLTGSSTLALRVSGSSAFTGSLFQSGSTVLSGSLLQSGSTQITGSTLLSGSLLLTGSSALALRVTGSSAFTGSMYVSGTVSGSFTGDGSSLTGIDGYTVANSANNRVITSVDSTNGNAEANMSFNGSTLNITGDATLTGTLTAATGTFVYQIFESSSTIISSGSNIFGDKATDIQQITGSLLQSGSTQISGSFLQIGSTQITGSTLLSGSLLLTGSSALALRVTGSTALTGSLFVSGAVSSSVGFSGSYQGDGSDLTGISAAAFPHTGSADISGSLTVTGSAYVTSLIETSALRFKKYVKDLPEQTNTVFKLRPVHFRWKEGNQKDVGLIAEEVQKIYPELVSVEDDGQAGGIKYTKLTAILVKTIQELTTRIEKLEKK